jgi:hypothetical protein
MAIEDEFDKWLEKNDIVKLSQPKKIEDRYYQYYGTNEIYTGVVVTKGYQGYYSKEYLMRNFIAEHDSKKKSA